VVVEQYREREIASGRRVRRSGSSSEGFYRVKPDVAHIRIFGCPMKVKLLARHLKELDDRVAMGYLLGMKYEGAYKVRVPIIGIRETRDNIPAPTMHDKVRAASMAGFKVPAGGKWPVPYSPALNGVAERIISVMMNAV
jgi:hypothetical protein